MDLQKKFTKETGLQVKESHVLEQVVVAYSDFYVDWLEQQLILLRSSLTLPSVCTGCGSLSTKVIDKKYLSCCPDSSYIPMEDYVKFSIYKPELRKR